MQDWGCAKFVGQPVFNGNFQLSPRTGGNGDPNGEGVTFRVCNNHPDLDPTLIDGPDARYTGAIIPGQAEEDYPCGATIAICTR